MKPKVLLGLLVLAGVTAGAIYYVKVRTAPKSTSSAPDSGTNDASAVTNLLESLSTNVVTFTGADRPFENFVRIFVSKIKSYWRVEVEAQDGLCTVKSYLEILPVEADDLARKLAVAYSRYRNNGAVTVKVYGPQKEGPWLLLAEANADGGMVTTATYLGKK